MADLELERDALIALMVAELDASVHGRGGVEVVTLPDRHDHTMTTLT